jgi:hypothetical protein
MSSSRNIMNTAVKLSFVAAFACLAACRKPAEKADESKLRLAAVRTAVQAYYYDHDGQFPATLDELIKDGKYLKELPALELPGHAANNKVQYISAMEVLPKNLDDAGGYAYYNSPKYPDSLGTVVINCTHKGADGAPLSSY